MIRQLLCAGLVVALSLVVSPAEAGRRYVQQQTACNSHYCTQQAFIAQPAYHAQPFVAATYNFVGAPVRLQAEQAYTMQNDPQWQAFQQFKSQQQAQAMAQQLFQQWTAQAQQQQQAPPAQNWQPPAEAPAEVPGQPAPPTAPQATAPGPLPPPVPSPPNVATPGMAPHAAVIPTLIEHCAKCHSGEKAKGDLWLDGSADLRADASYEKRDAIMRAIINQRMPKDGTLSAEAAGQIVTELYID